METGLSRSGGLRSGAARRRRGGRRCGCGPRREGQSEGTCRQAARPQRRPRRREPDPRRRLDGRVRGRRGKVTASSATSLTLARADGKSVTFSVTSTTVARRIVTVGRPAIVFSRNGAAFRIIAAGPVTMAPVMPALAGKSPVVHLDVKFVRADGSTGSITLDRGQVTASSSTSLTIKRDDGKSVTFTIGAGATVRGHLAVGGKALVLSRNGAVVRVLARG